MRFSMRELVVLGTLGGVRASMKRAEVRAVAGDPDEWSGDSLATATIWRYGFFEVHFDDDVAFLVYTDYVDPPNAGPGRTLDRWIFGDRPPSRAELVAALDAEGVSWSARDDGLVLRIKGGAEITFLEPADSTRGYDEVHGIAAAQKAPRYATRAPG